MAIKDWKADASNIGKSINYSKMSRSDLALHFKIIQDQIKDSRGETKKELIKERMKIVRAYKRK